MRSKLLGLAIALSTFGLGIFLTTLWIAYRTPDVTALESPADFPDRPGSFGMEESPIPSVRFVAQCGEGLPSTGKISPSFTVEGGLLNDKAISKPTPAYPPMGRMVQASGKVVVEVWVDECGKVFFAKAASGHPLLRQAAVRAAYDTLFAATFVNGQPAKLKGTLVYNFVLT